MSIKIDLRFPKINLKKDLKDIAEQIIIPDIQGHLFNATDISGIKYPPLAESTKKIRTKKDQGLIPLKATGQLRKSITAKNVKGGVLIFLKGNRRKSKLTNRELGDILQNEGVKSKDLGKRFFEFFGISSLAEGNSVEFMKERIDEDIKRGKRRTVK